MPDMQKSHDDRNIAIDKVGVKDISYPIVVMDKSKEQQQTVARINMYVDLPHHFKGTHMSRFIEILNQYHGQVSIDRMNTMLSDMKRASRSQPRPPRTGVSLFHREAGSGVRGAQPDGVPLQYDRQPGQRITISSLASPYP